MTSRQRNRLVDLGLMVLVAVVCIGTASMTMAGIL